MLATLSNIDKHHIVHPAFNIVGYDASATLDKLVNSAQQEGPTPVVGWWMAKSGRLEHGTLGSESTGTPERSHPGK